MLLMPLALRITVLLDSNVPKTDDQHGNWVMVVTALVNYYLHLMGLEAAPTSHLVTSCPSSWSINQPSEWKLM